MPLRYLGPLRIRTSDQQANEAQTDQMCRRELMHIASVGGAVPLREYANILNINTVF